MFDNIQFMGDHWVCWFDGEEECEGTNVAYVEVSPMEAAIGYTRF